MRLPLQLINRFRIVRNIGFLELPVNDYYEYFGPEYKLHLPVSNMENLNTREFLD